MRFTSETSFAEDLNAHAAWEHSLKRTIICTQTLTTICLLLFNAVAVATETQMTKLRPPAVPLITHDPYFSIWSMGTELNTSWPKHWTGKVHGMCSMVQIDNEPFRIMGEKPFSIPALKQVSVQVLPTQTVYKFEDAGVRLSLTFTTPALPHNLNILARPATYLTWSAESMDGKAHKLRVYFDAAAEIAVTKVDQQVQVKRPEIPGLAVMAAGSVDQPVLKKKGDDLRIDWGHLYVAIPKSETATSVTHVIAGHETSRNYFIATGRTFPDEDNNFPRQAQQNWPLLACSFPLDVTPETSVSRHVIMAYDDEYSLELFGKKLRPYWRRDGMGAEQLLTAVENDYEKLMAECEAFDKEFMTDLTAAHGEKYALLCALSYRQCLAAHKMAANEDGSLVMLSKENFSNGCIGTVDVLYPASPMFMLFNPELLKAQVTPIMDYSISTRWKFPFAPHDLGTYPLANGQVYGGGEVTEKDQMPVEESGNMLILLAAIAQLDGNADYAKPYWSAITKWAEYLKEKGLDPDNQLCTDDFAGHLAHNTNLSVKAIMGIGSYALLCEMDGRTSEAAAYKELAASMAPQWIEKAEDGDHYRLTFDKPGTWSQKYNLVWDQLLGLKIFPPEVAAKEVAYYKTKINRYGLPLDSRQTYTKLDWCVWTATLTTNAADFDAMINPLYDFANETPDRSPLTDWFETVTGKRVGFTARPVVGGNFIPLLRDMKLSAKWRKKAAVPVTKVTITSAQ